MDEEQMWKGFYQKISEKKLESDETKNKFENLDGGFFEKFGSLLQQKSQLEEDNLTSPLASLKTLSEEEHHNLPASYEEILPKVIEVTEEENENCMNTSGENNLDSDNVEVFLQEEYKNFMGEIMEMNVEKLYEEILYEILNNIGCETDENINKDDLFNYVQKAFKISEEEHKSILDSVQSRGPPKVCLNVEVIKGENLSPKDSNGLSDPFVTLYLESNSTHKFNTSFKTGTLNPVWGQNFSLAIPDNSSNEILVVEVWDFDPAETLKEKAGKILNVKGLKGLRKYVKEIALTASTGKHDNELIGKATIPLKSIPATGIKNWYNLGKNKKSRTRGSVLLKLNFGAEKDNKVMIQEHRNLLQILLMHEIETTNPPPYDWNGKFGVEAETILIQHSIQNGLSTDECALAEWSAFTNVHHQHFLSFSLFNDVINKMEFGPNDFLNGNDERKLFWEGVKKFLPSCCLFIRKLRDNSSHKNHLEFLNSVLNVISIISKLEIPKDIDLFSSEIYKWASGENNNDHNSNLCNIVESSVKMGTKEWFDLNDDNIVCRNVNKNDEEKLQHLIKLIQLIRTDLKYAIEFYDRIFKQKANFFYSKSLYDLYEKKLKECIQPIVEDMCINLKRLQILENGYVQFSQQQETGMGTALFELYLVLKRFVLLGMDLHQDGEELEIYEYYKWFTNGVTHWMDISYYKAQTRIEKAIELDTFKPIDEYIRHSSSPTDTFAIFYQIKIFWQQLDWPDIISAFTFISKIVDDVCHCCVFYSEKMFKRIKELQDNKYKDAEIIQRDWCLVINNINYIQKELPLFIEALDVDKIIIKMSEYISSLEAERCKDTLKNFMNNTIDTENNKIMEAIETIVREMSPTMKNYLTEAAEILHENSNCLEKLMNYLEDSLSIFNSELNRDNFEKLLNAIWVEFSCILYEFVQSSINNRKVPAFFANLGSNLEIMVTSFKLEQYSNCSSVEETLACIQHLIKLHASETGDLIYQYYVEKLNDQKNMTENPYGQLCIKANLSNYNLNIEILNANNLVPKDSKGHCDPYVKMNLIPGDKFIGIALPKTGVHHKTNYPLFDENFSIPLTEEQREFKNAMIVFSIKDKDLFGINNQYVAECYLSFNDIENSNGEQIHLPLSKSEYKVTECLRVLEHRNTDKQAKDFIRKLKQK